MTVINKINDKGPKFIIDDIVRLSKYKHILQKVTLQIGWKKYLLLKKLKILCRGNILLMILMERKLLERFTKKKLQKTNKKEFRIAKVTKRKGDKSYVKGNNSFNSWINKKDISEYR